ncbi:MAG: hypothetical protein GX256_10100 [Fretibacterium sp.]|nr:hypothetical protein [Fretibacterium sp.]
MKKLRTQMRWIMVVIVVAFLLSTFLMYGGRNRGPRRGSDGRLEDYEVAQVNGRPLMRSELERRVRFIFEQYHRRGITSVDIPALYQAALEQYVVELQMVQAVKDRGISVSDAEAEQTMKAYADEAFPTREAFYQSLEMSGTSVADYKKGLARQMANERLLSSVVGTVVVSEDEAVQFYDTMKGLFSQPAASKIHLASFFSSADAEALRGRLLQGMDWGQATSSDVMSSEDVRNVTSEPLLLQDSTFDSGALAPMKDLKINEVSPVLEITSDDFAVGLKLEALDERTAPYDEVSADIRVLLRQQKEREHISRFNEELLQKAQVVIHDPSLFPQPTSLDLPAVTSPDAAEAEKEKKKKKKAGEPISDDSVPKEAEKEVGEPTSGDLDESSKEASGDQEP